MESNRGRKKKEVNYNSPFAARLRDLLAKTKTTQPMLAEAIGVSRQAIGQWKDGNTLPDIMALSKIADYFNVSADYLLGRTEIVNTDPDKQINVACEYTGLSENTVNVLHDRLTKPCGEKQLASMAFKVKDGEKEYYRNFYIYDKKLSKCINDFLKKEDGIELLMLIDQYIFLNKADIKDNSESLDYALQFEIIDRLKRWQKTKYHIDFSDLL